MKLIASLAIAAALLGAAGYSLARTDEHATATPHQAPTLNESGQAGFAAIHEVAEALLADPSTDWSLVNVDGLRNHLVDMDAMMMHAEVRYEDVAGGVRIHVSGDGRARDAIRNMLMMHARMAGDAEHWTMTAEETRSGVLLTVQPRQPSDMAIIHGLGLFGMLAAGDHHQMHHGGMATGLHNHG